MARNKTNRCEATDLERCRVARLFYQLTSGANDRSWIWQQIPFEAHVANSRKCTGRHPHGRAGSPAPGRPNRRSLSPSPPRPPMSAFLPAFDPDPETRAAARTAKQAEYAFNHKYVSPLALVDDVPGRDRFPLDFTTLVLGKVMTYVSNEADADSALRRRLRKMDTPLTDAALAASTAVRAVAGVVETVIGYKAESRRLLSIDDYNSLFHVIGLPPISK